MVERGSEQTDEELYRKIKKGDLAAFDVLYERYQLPLLQFIKSYLKNREQAEEVFHESFMQVLRTPETQFSEGSFRGWIFQVARNLSLNRIRAVGRGYRAAEALSAEEVSPTAEGMLISHMEAIQVKKVLEALPENLAEVLKLRLSGLAYRDIAGKLEIPVGTVKSRFHSIVQFIKSEVKS
jgi:RNA polymerase sigma-70 factor (ECF subfamily)